MLTTIRLSVLFRRMFLGLYRLVALHQARVNVHRGYALGRIYAQLDLFISLLRIVKCVRLHPVEKRSRGVSSVC